uniref:anti-sigma factor n=1 Tax=Pararhizobium sp. IMCC3301 TaxID=3067904 RepID=UPI00274070FB|nr:hypothetical protein [Pararhizobium sp. IMCC3301]
MTDTHSDDFENDPRAVAGEYVLDTLSVAERAEFEALLLQDEALVNRVDEWKQLLAPVLESAPPVQPGASVWNRIEASLNRHPGGESELRDGAAAGADETPINLDRVRKSRNRWRGLSLAMLSLAAGLTAFALIDGRVLQPASVVPDQMAVLTGPASPLQFIAIVDPARQGIYIRPLNGVAETASFADGPLELWVQTATSTSYLGLVTSAQWRWLDYAAIMPTEAFAGATLLLTRISAQQPTPPEVPGETIFRGKIITERE